MPGSWSSDCSRSWSRSRPDAAATTTTTAAVAESEALTELGEGEGEVNLVAWAGYVEDGSTDPEGRLGDGLREGDRLPGQRQDRQHLRRDGAADAHGPVRRASPPPATRPTRLIEGGDVDPVNTDLIPNYADVYDALKDQDFNSVDGQMYGVPHGRGSNLLMYDPDEVSPRPTSWDVVFDKADEYSGKVTAYDNPIYIADAALYLREHQPDLGIEDPYELDQEQFDAAIELLKQQGEHVGEYWSDYTKEIQAFANGDSSVGHHLAGDQTTCSTPTASQEEVVLPEEGATGWSDTWMISSEAANPNCMYMWMDHIISPEANAAVAEWFGEAPSNEKACELTADPEALRDLPRRRRGVLRPDRVLEDPRLGLRRRSRRCLQDLRRLGPGLDRGQGLAAPSVESAGRSRTARKRSVGRRLAGLFHGRPRLQAGALLAGPVGWLVVGYLGSLARPAGDQLLDSRRAQRRDRADVHARQLPATSSRRTSTARSPGARS